MSPTVEVEVRRNRHGSVLAYADRDRAARLLDDHRGVIQSLYDLVDRRHGADGDVVARLSVREDARVVEDLDLRDRFRRDLDADRAISLVEDLRYHAGEHELVTDGGADRDGGGEDENGADCHADEGEEGMELPLTWCTTYTILDQVPDPEKYSGKFGRILGYNHRSSTETDLARVAEPLKLRNALLVQLVRDRRRDAARNNLNPDRNALSDRATATDVVDVYGDLYGGDVTGWPFDAVSERTDDMGDQL
ncbi:hypothetical protein DM2_2129 [Halorubrum sp. DM2]|uniref:hypothetical protein n=1 Tax=Halorubrum sp. DM2 TaxID=2527867 RepID=UPI0024B7E03B|nr:hypothetical protein [Halorubrum sp. DM2]VTT86091.1 hypothetical protein DM2_2129 [Halorubrum sp. DM2]